MRARVTGILEKKLFQEGAPVKAGQALFTIDPKIPETKNLLTTAKIRIAAGPHRQLRRA